MSDDADGADSTIKHYFAPLYNATARIRSEARDENVDGISKVAEGRATFAFQRTNVTSPETLPPPLRAPNEPEEAPSNCLVAALKVRKQIQPNCGFILVVCRASCANQWFSELEAHFEEEHCPRAIVLDSIKVSMMDLLAYDIVICSVNFLRNRYMDQMKWNAYAQAVTATDTEMVKDAVGHISSPALPLHSDMYDKLGKHIAVLILDESHDYKNDESLSHSAALSPKYHSAFLLSGTLIYNSWQDLAATPRNTSFTQQQHRLAGQVMLLPSCPFVSAAHFREIFRTPPNDEGQSKGPQGVFMAALVRFFTGIFVSRTKAVLGLPKWEAIDLTVNFTEEDRYTLLAVASLVIQDERLIWPKKKMGRRDNRRQAMLKMGFGLLCKAEQLAAHPALVNSGILDEEDLTVSDAAFSRFSDMSSMNWIGSWRTARRPLGRRMTNRSKSWLPWRTKSFRSSKRHWLHSPDDKTTARKEALAELRSTCKHPAESESESEDVTDLEDFGNNIVLVEHPISYDDQLNLRRAAIRSYKEQEFNYVEDQDDPDYDPNVDIPRTDPEYTQRWLATVAKLTNEEVKSPRVAAVVEKIMAIHAKEPERKFLVASPSVLELDIIKEALRREMDLIWDPFTVTEYNGSIKSMDDRSDIAYQFNLAMSKGDLNGFG
ncbi:hypothetical protein FALBO_327 [Fusarium albosuccineum]|uniref:Helicase ATP-binding domain-containing protein n=1 Tax=Fusarium albosuccineum TaxID=1237068 RepID=A0A8H4LQR0_9HYPO|nr:hypothetical protein FALBO_327 [Fusarium albosuccineum]